MLTLLVDKFNKLGKLEGPVGGDDGKYGQSDAWKALESTDEHYFNFVSFFPA